MLYCNSLIASLQRLLISNYYSLMNVLPDGVTRLSDSESPTMDHNSQLDDERATVPLIYDYFRAHFAHNNTSFPLQEAQFHDPAVIESKEYKRIRTILIQAGQMHMDTSRERLAENIDAFLPGLQHPLGRNSFDMLSQELFKEGIKWNFILTYFVFCAELSFQADKQGSARVEDIINWMAMYINKHLFQWIVDHGGWVGFSF